MACYVSTDEDSDPEISMSEDETVPLKTKKVSKAAANPPQRATSKRQKKLPSKLRNDDVLLVSKEEENFQNRK